MPFGYCALHGLLAGRAKVADRTPAGHQSWTLSGRRRSSSHGGYPAIKAKGKT